MHAVGMASTILRIERLQPGFHFVERGGVQKSAKVRISQQFLQLRLINGQCLRTPFRERSVTVVNVIRDVGKQQRCRERRRPLRLKAGDANRTALNSGKDRSGGGQIKNIANALAIGLQNNWKRREPCGYGKKIGRTFALLPERRAHAGAPLRKQQSTACRFAKLGCKKGSAPELPKYQVPEFRGRGQQIFCTNGLLVIWKTKHKAVVRPHRLDFETTFRS